MHSKLMLCSFSVHCFVKNNFSCCRSVYLRLNFAGRFYNTWKISIRFGTNTRKFSHPNQSLALALPFLKKLVARSNHSSSQDRIAGLRNELCDSKHEYRKFARKSFWSLLWNCLRPYCLLLLLAIALAVCAAIINIKIPLQLGLLINAAAAINAHTGALNSLHRPAFHLLCLYGLQSVLTASYVALLSVIGERTARDLRNRLFHSLIHQEAEFFDRKRTGELVARLSGDVQDFKSCFKQIISQGLKSLTQTVGCAISLYLISPNMTLITLGLLPCIISIGSTFGSVLRKLSKQAQQQVGIATAVADEALCNIRTVKSFAMEESEERLFEREIEHSRKLNELLGIGIGLFHGLSNLVLNGIVLGVIYGGSHLMNRGEMTAGQLMSFLITSQVVQKSLGQLSLLFGQVVKGTSAASRVFEYMSEESVADGSSRDIIPLNSLLGEVRFTDVAFSYPTRPDFAVLNGFSIVLPPGKKVALCGPSGGGKSTVAALLECFYDVDSGSITIDGKDVRQLDTKWLRGTVIGFISQEPVLFHTTIKENIRYGKPDASDADIYEAARTANADSFIRSFPDGYDTVVGERGATLSGGQKQRIAIARALLKNPPILILDEATSALDVESEKLVQDALEKAEKGRTVLVIAHRLSSVRNADYIAVVDNKKISETGTYEELMRANGIFWKLVQHQRLEE